MAAVARLLPRHWDGHRLLQFLTGLALIALAFAVRVDGSAAAIAAAPPPVETGAVVDTASAPARAGALPAGAVPAGAVPAGAVPAGAEAAGAEAAGAEAAGAEAAGAEAAGAEAGAGSHVLPIWTVPAVPAGHPLALPPATTASAGALLPTQGSRAPPAA